MVAGDDGELNGLTDTVMVLAWGDPYEELAPPDDWAKVTALEPPLLQEEPLELQVGEDEGAAAEEVHEDVEAEDDEELTGL